MCLIECVKRNRGIGGNWDMARERSDKGSVRSRPFEPTVLTVGGFSGWSVGLRRFWICRYSQLIACEK